MDEKKMAKLMADENVKIRMKCLKIANSKLNAVTMLPGDILNNAIVMNDWVMKGDKGLSPSFKKHYRSGRCNPD